MAWLLQLTAQVAQALPPIQVTVQQAPGMPEWVKILITAATGALLGVGSNIAMEYLKPWIALRQIRKTVTTQLAAELRDNLNAVEGAQRIVLSAENKEKEEKDAAVAVARVALRTVQADRYKFYFSEHKAVVYEVDPAKLLIPFYGMVEVAASEDDYEELKKQLSVAVSLGHAFFQSKQLTYQAQPNVVEQAFTRSGTGSAVPGSGSRDAVS